MDTRDAYDELAERQGRSILAADFAREIADAFGVELEERIGELTKLKHLDRLQPDNENRGIGVGTLCKVIAEKRDGLEAEGFHAIGHGTTQDGLKDRNLPKLQGLVATE